mmetsp:Transcript_36805/g.64502  ORF Transcript_36805/g.64502 Transcript_36805/m.64502 type:complete len:242 (+) Transcript_36805:1-726(+)
MFEEENGESISSSFSRRKRKQTRRFTPPPRPLKKIKVDEIPKASMPLKQQKTKKASVPARKERVKEEDSDFIRKNLVTVAKVPSGLAPGPGWKSKIVREGHRTTTRWISPREEIIFKSPRLAFEFEDIRLQCSGDEGQALDLYKKRRHAAGKKPYIINQGRLGRAAQGEATKKAPTPDKVPSVELKSNTAVEERTESSDPNESMTIAEIENDYNKLWDYYLKPATRENEELPSGMILRRKR